MKSVMMKKKNVLPKLETNVISINVSRKLQKKYEIIVQNVESKYQLYVIYILYIYMVPTSAAKGIRTWDCVTQVAAKVGN